MLDAPAESPQISSPLRGTLHASDGDGDNAVVPHTASGASTPGEDVRIRVLAVKLDLRNDLALFQRLKDLSWQAARYRNLYLRALWAEAKNLKVDPTKNIPHDVTKWIRHDEKMELSSSAYSAAEREVMATWQRHKKRILAGAPLPEWRTTAALTVRGQKDRATSGIRLSADPYVADLQVQGDKCEGGCWLHIPLACGASKDWQVFLLNDMAAGKVPIHKGSIVIRPERRQVMLHITYGVPIRFAKFGERKATLGPIYTNNRLWLRTEYESRDFTGRLVTLLKRKADWDGIRRRVLCQIGRRKGSARSKRQLLSKMTWDGWLQNWLHQWSRQIIDWLESQGIGDLTVIGLENADWPAFRFTQLLKDKGDEIGLVVHTEADLATPSTSRAVDSEIKRQRRKATKAGKAIRELQHQYGEN
jgi:hypothetical protein